MRSIQWKQLDTEFRDAPAYTGSLTVSGSLTVTGSIESNSFTGSLFGTASSATSAFLAQNAISASFAATASFVPNGITGTGTANELTYFTGASTIGSLSTATYPSLTELSYVKGVTSAIQTQLNARVTGTIASGQVAFGTGVNTIGASIIDQSSSIISIRSNSGGTSTNYPSLHIRDTFNGSYSGIGAILGELGFWGDDISGLGSRLRGAIRLINSSGTNGNLNDLVHYYSDGVTSGLLEAYRFSYLGRLGILTNSPTNTLDVNGTGRIRNGVSLADTSGNVQIGTTTDAGFRLDVNGTARVTGNLTTNLTAGRIPFIGTGGVLSENANFTYTDSSNQILLNTLRLRGSDSDFLSVSTPIISATSGTGTSIPFTQLGNLVLTARTNLVSRHVYIASFNGTDINWRWQFMDTGFLQSNGATTIRTSTGDLTIATNGGNGNIALLPNGTGGVGVGTSSPNAVAQLEVSSTTKGFLPPRMTTAQRDLIAAVAGLVIYNTTTNKHQGHNGTAWQDFY